MKVYTFGCSWTYGSKDENYEVVSWVEELAKMFPDIEFVDYAYPGTCIEYSTFLLNNILKEKAVEDKIVFQFTLPYRYTTWTDSNVLLSNDYRYAKTENYTKFKLDLRERIERYMGAWSHMPEEKTDRFDMEFYKRYYLRFNEKKELSSYYAISEYVKQKADYSFFHVDYNMMASGVGKKHTDNMFVFEPSIQATLGQKQFIKYAWDMSKHFNNEGCKHVAKIVATQLGLKTNEIK